MAQHVEVIIPKIQSYIDNQLISMAQNNPLIALTKPLISRIINNNTYKMEFLLKQLADKDGFIDTDGILSEMIESIMSTKPFKLDSGFLGELELGGGKIKMNIPFINKALILDQKDLLELKNVLSR